MDKRDTIEECVERALIQGRWGLFDRLPSERSLAEEFGVNRATLRAALRALASRGILETRRGSGTVVRALPAARRRAETLKDCLEAFRLFMPPLVVAVSAWVSPTAILDLERLLPVAGAALRGGDTRAFIQAQLRFFLILIRAGGNPCVERAACGLLPDGRELARLLHNCPLLRSEALFAQLARLLSSLRHADPDGAAAAAEGYAATLLRLQEERPCQG